MRDIEVASYRLYHGNLDDGLVTSPLIDWGWETAPYRWNHQGPLYEQPQCYGVPRKYKEKKEGQKRSNLVGPFLYAGVMLPHVIAVVGGLILFYLGLTNRLPGLNL
jgi:hypothetical protein